MDQRIKDFLKRFLSLSLVVVMLLTSGDSLLMYQAFGAEFDEKSTEIGEESNEGNTEGGGEEVPEVEIAGKSSPASADVNISVDATLVVAGNKNTVEAGEAFQYKFTYSIPSLDSNTGAGYVDCKIMIPIPKYAVIQKEENGSFKIQGADVDMGAVEYDERAGVLIIPLVSPLVNGNTGTVNIFLKTENLMTPNSTELSFGNALSSAKMIGQFRTNGEAALQTVDKPVPILKMTVDADTTWDIDKSIVKEEEVTEQGVRYYDATYQITVSDKSGTNHLGRLGLQAYEIIDTLPAVLSDGRPLPQGGEAISISDILMLNESGNVNLSRDIDYSIQNSNGHPTGIQFYTMDTIKEGDSYGQYESIGQERNTTYQYTVRYPMQAYLTEATEDNLIQYLLTNKADLIYTLLGDVLKSDQATQEILIQGWESEPVNANVSIRKYIKIGDETFLMNSAGSEKYGKATFGIFTDSQCQKPAVNIDKNKMVETIVANDGTVTFEKIRFGTYYIKEMQTPTGFRQPSQPIKVVIDKDGKLTIEGNADVKLKDGVIEVVNEAETIGALEFTKKGNDAFGESENQALEGVTFTLKGNGKTFQAVSDKNGKVRFDAIPEGTYTLEETVLPAECINNGYVLPDDGWEIKITANEVLKPKFDGSNTILNQSPKGILKIIKKDAQNDQKSPLPGAEFAVYGPYASNEDAGKQGNNPNGAPVTSLVTKANGTAVSVSLLQGYYIIKETKAPDNYVLMSDVQIVQIEAQKTLEQTILNDQRAKITFRKQGTNNSEPTSWSYSQELAGAKFQLFDKTGQPLKGVTDEQGNIILSNDGEDVIITTVLDATGISTSNGVYLSPGDYQYLELSVPAPYKKIEGLQSFTVKSSGTGIGSAYLNQTIPVRNYIQYGQIKIVKTRAKSTEGINGAVFGIYETNTSDWSNPIDTLTTSSQWIADGQGSGEYQKGIAFSGAQLEMGKTYYIREISSPSGYVLSTTVGEVKVDEKTGVVTYTCENEPFASIEVIKKDSITKSGIAGAGFELYTKNGDDFLKVKNEATSDANGKITFTGLAPNTQYYLLESTVPAGYVKKDSVGAVIVDKKSYIPVKTKAYDGSEASLITGQNIENDRKAVYKIQKMKEMDGAETAFSTVTFTLYAKTKSNFEDEPNEKQLVKTGSTNAQGNLQWEDIEPGDYWLVETLQNEYKDLANPKDIEYWAVTIQPGLNQSGGYDQAINKLLNIPKKGRIQLGKYGANTDGSCNTNNPLSGVIFNVYAGTEATGTPIELKSNASGVALSDWLAPGQYTIVETSTNIGYILDNTPYKVTVEAAKTTKADQNKVDLTKIINKKTGGISIKKYGSYHVTDSSNQPDVIREQLAGATFALYKYEEGQSTHAAGSKIINSEFVMGTFQYMIPDLEPGIYWLVEEAAPDASWEKAEDSLFRINPDGSTQIGTVDSTTKTVTYGAASVTAEVKLDDFSNKPRIRINKTEYQTGKALDGGKFELYKVDAQGEPTDIRGETINLKKIDGGHSIYESGTARDENGNLIEGQALTIKLEAGETYYLKETEAPRYYYFTDPWTGPIQLGEDIGGAEITVTVENYKEVEVPGQKIHLDEKGNQTSVLKGAAMAVFETEEEAIAMQVFMKANYDELTNTWKSGIDIESDEFKTLHKIKEISISGALGAFSFANLAPGYTYFVMEILPAQYYQLEKTLSDDYLYYKVTVSDPYTAAKPFETITRSDQETPMTNVHTLQISNYIRKHILFSKINNLSGRIFYLDGAKFKVYGAKSENGQMVPDLDKVIEEVASSTNGRYSTGLLPAGTYFIEETAPPNGFLQEVEPRENVQIYDGRRFYKVELSRAQNNTDWDIDNPIVNTADKGKFMLSKISSLSKTTKINATFAVAKYDTESAAFVTYSKYPSMTTNKAEAYFTSDYMETGIYRLTETSVESGYTLDATPIYIEIEANKITDGSSCTAEDSIKVKDEAIQVYRPAKEMDVTKLTAIQVLNVPKGQLKIYKKGTFNNSESEALGNVVFQVYKNTAGAQSELGDYTADKTKQDADQDDGFPKTMTTIASGETKGFATLNDLDAGWYWIVETSVGTENQEKYEKSSYDPIAKEVLPGAGNTVQLVVENTSNLGKFKVKKVDANDEKILLSGANFEILNQEKQSFNPKQYMTDQNNGYYLSGLLATGMYYLKEVGTPSRYTTNKDRIFGSFKVAANTLTEEGNQSDGENAVKGLYVVKNEKDNTLIITKKGQLATDDETIGVITTSSATFALYDTQEKAEKATAEEPGTYVKLGQTNAGSITWEGLADGTYYLKELTPPKNYIASTQILQIVLNNSTETEYTKEVKNILRGDFKIKKITNWGEEQNAIPISGITFDIYNSSNKKIGSVTTDVNGEANSKAADLQLDPGDYVLKEQLKDGYAPISDISITITNGTTNTQYFDNPIVNKAVWGRFSLKKQSSTENKEALSGAQFSIQKWLVNEKEWSANLSVGSVDYFTITEENGIYISGMMEPGRYRVIETKEADAIQNSENETVQFAKDAEPVEFEIQASATVEVIKENTPKRDLLITKVSDAKNGSRRLDGAVFELWTYDQKGSETVPVDKDDILKHKGSQIGSEQTTDSQGNITWNYVSPGRYILIETKAPDGYEKVVKVINIPETESLDEIMYEQTIVDDSVQGKIRIRKEDMDGNLICKDGKSATFKIYAENDAKLENPLQTVVVENGQDGMSNLLDLGSYWIVEVQAPDAYILDDRLLPTKKLVTITGVHAPDDNYGDITATDSIYRDKVLFANRTKASVAGFSSSIDKKVKLNGDENQSTDFADQVSSTVSLMFGDVQADFLISKLTDGKNELSATSFVVTDSDLKFQGQNGSDYYDVDAEHIDAADYEVNAITVFPSYNEDSKKKVSAQLEVKIAGVWEIFSGADSQLADLGSLNNAGVKIILPEGTTGFRLSYSGVERHFTAGDLIMHVTFHQRGSNAEMPDIRRVVNTVQLDWMDTRKDEKGNSDPSSAMITFPDYDGKLPYLTLQNEIVSGSDKIYYAGGTVDFRTTGGVTELEEVTLKNPIMSIVLPPCTTLDSTKYPSSGNGGIRATINGTAIPFTLSDPIEVQDAKGNKTWQYVLDFGDLLLEPGESIVLDYTVNIGLNVPNDVITMQADGYIGSAYQLPLTSDNTHGTSFKQNPGDSSKIDTNKTIDGVIDLQNETIDGDGLEYLKQPVSVRLTASNVLQARKYIGTKEGEYLPYKEIPTVNPTDTLYYKLSLTNGGDPAKTLRFVDILPFNGDSFEYRDTNSNVVTSRDTSIPSGEGYEKVSLISVNGNPNGIPAESVKVYYYVGETWDSISRLAKPANVELPMLWSKDQDVWSGWTETAPADMSKVTAIGVEVILEDDSVLNKGETYDVALSMRTPGYTADLMEEYEGKLIANSTATAVIRANDTNLNGTIKAADHVGSNQVKAKLRMTTGSIGDYSFYDNNDNGIQDQGDTPARNIPVTLYQTKTTANGQTKETYETVTDNTTGKYVFEKLPCNYRTKESYEDPEFENDPQNPKYYVGNAYYSYQVGFTIPSGYGATIQYANGKDNVDYEEEDSNIDSEGKTDPISLTMTVDENNILIGEDNMTIDAGFVKRVKLGDYVWADTNKNGIQDPNENGVNGVLVKLYQLDEVDGTIDGKMPYQEHVTANNAATGLDGYYCFSNLPKGYYVVEFDISQVKTGGYTQYYSFTKVNAGSMGADSDAKHDKDGNSKIRYTDVIQLTEDNMTWDAGLTIYSALGGFCFDDQDYDNQRSLDIPLLGTKVDLYGFDENGVRTKDPMMSTVVDKDGCYLFDELEAGKYQIHFDYPDHYVGVKAGVGGELCDSETRYFDDSTLNSGFSGVIELPENTADLTHDAGAYLLSSIGDYIWKDTNKNGIQDAGEAPVENINVYLQQKTSNGEWEKIQTTVTDQNGFYIFKGIKSSAHYDMEYRVVFGIDRMTPVTKEYQGKDREKDSNVIGYEWGLGYITDSIHPGYGASDMTIDAGILEDTRLCEVGDYVWYDTNQNGIQDDGEKVVEGITVILQKCDSGNVTDSNAWKTAATTVTDTNGKYIFTELPFGYYRVGFTVEDPYTVTYTNRGTGIEAIARDSDATKKEGSAYFSRAFYLNPGASDMTWDAGIYLSSEKKKSTTITTISGNTVIVRKSIPGRTRSARTGDTTKVLGLIVVLGISGCIIIFVLLIKKRRKRERSL